MCFLRYFFRHINRHRRGRFRMSSRRCIDRGFRAFAVRSPAVGTTPPTRRQIHFVDDGFHVGRGLACSTGAGLAGTSATGSSKCAFDVGTANSGGAAAKAAAEQLLRGGKICRALESAPEFRVSLGAGTILFALDRNLFKRRASSAVRLSLPAPTENPGDLPGSAYAAGRAPIWFQQSMAFCVSPSWKTDRTSVNACVT